LSLRPPAILSANDCDFTHDTWTTYRPFSEKSAEEADAAEAGEKVSFLPAVFLVLPVVLPAGLFFAVSSE
jgi:hypothetical protein